MACPVCSRPTAADYRPFCSKRCADLDLGRWLSGDYRLPSTDPEDVEEAQDEIARRSEIGPGDDDRHH